MDDLGQVLYLLRLIHGVLMLHGVELDGLLLDKDQVQIRLLIHRMEFLGLD